jgi:hypothetical protein
MVATSVVPGARTAPSRTYTVDHRERPPAGSRIEGLDLAIETPRPRHKIRWLCAAISMV